MKRIVALLGLIVAVATVMVYMNAGIQSPSLEELSADIEREMQKLESASKDFFELQANKRKFVIEALAEEDMVPNPDFLNTENDDIEKIIKTSRKKTHATEQRIKEFNKKIDRKNQEIRQINQRIGKLKGKIEYNQQKDR